MHNLNEINLKMLLSHVTQGWNLIKLKIKQKGIKAIQVYL